MFYVLVGFRNQCPSEQEADVLENVQNEEKALSYSPRSKIPNSIELDDEFSNEAIEMLPLSSFAHSHETPDILITPSPNCKDKHNGKRDGKNVTSVALVTPKNKIVDEPHMRNEKSSVKLDEETKQVVN